ncbi:hypothetical protein ABZ929_23170 [Streptomyces physcomitrii]|uniref:hypothetical protein n=1 Tax=Streptomyces physcomitrii TaxID=2724184 RepID=UPI00341DE88E
MEPASPQRTVVTAADMERRWEALCSWAVANGLDPRQIARDSLVICRHGGRPAIEYRAFVLDELGRNRLDPRHDYRCLTTTRTARMTRALTEYGLTPDQLGT